MRNISIFSFSAILAITVFLVVCFSIVEYITYDTPFYEKQFEVNNTSELTGIDSEGLKYIVGETQALLKGNRRDYYMSVFKDGENRDIFGFQENLHMIEVASLFQRFTRVRAVSCVIAVTIIIAMAILQGKASVKFFFRSLIFAIVCVAVLGSWAILDFTTFFTVFHEVIFNNDNWLFPTSSVLIQILDFPFFIAFAKRVIVLLCSFYIALIILLIVLYKKFKTNTV